jgi:hypothetical protein
MATFDVGKAPGLVTGNVPVVAGRLAVAGGTRGVTPGMGGVTTGIAGSVPRSLVRGPTMCGCPCGTIGTPC